MFNGDFVDRGSQSVEVALLLFSFLLVYPSAIFINRGNHEDYVMNLRSVLCTNPVSNVIQHIVGMGLLMKYVRNMP